MHGVNMNGFELTEQKIDQLVELALRARERAYVPYSHFRVGACLMSKKRNAVLRLQYRKRRLYAHKPCGTDGGI